jgi:hypothetical protein
MEIGLLLILNELKIDDCIDHINYNLYPTYLYYKFFFYIKDHKKISRFRIHGFLSVDPFSEIITSYLKSCFFYLNFFAKYVGST